ncbi:MAG TPA: cell envelope integrity protein TolA [Thiotrichales bacterium]|nr:cell envelope integrity protein TolA [Thiotrichales bacterium]
MWRLIREDPRAFVFALLAHVALLVFLFVGLDWNIRPPAGGAPRPKAIQAVAVDEARVQAELKKLEEAEKRRQREAEARLRKLREEARKAEQKRIQEQKRLAELKRKREQEAKRRAELERKKKLEAKRKAELKRKQEAERKRREEAERKRRAEEKRKAELAAKKKREEEARRKAEEEARRKAEEAKRRAEEEARRKAEAALKEQLAAEQAALAAEQARRDQRIVDQYIAAIRQKVERNWIQPATSRKGLFCLVQVSLIPGGEVTSVQIVQGSGDAAFDRSVEAAVYRASPLPLPSDARLFDRFRRLTFRFSPK